MDEFCKRGQDVSQARYARELKSHAYDTIRTKPIIKTTAEDLRAVLKRGGAVTNNYLLRRQSGGQSREDGRPHNAPVVAFIRERVFAAEISCSVHA